MNHRFHTLLQQAETRVGAPAWHALRAHPRICGSVAGALTIAAGAAWWWERSHRPSADELERRRREHLTHKGRITDGHIVDARTLQGDDDIAVTPQVLVYSYRLAGVTYQCAQDVSSLPELVRGYRLDQPVSVRYDPQHPGNSILVSETWSGLWQRGKN